MHVTQWQRDQSAGDAVANGENFIGIGAGEARAAFVLQREFGFFGCFHQSLDDERVVAGAVGHGRAAAEDGGSMFGLIDAWSIGGVGDVEANGDIWAQAVGDHFGAIAADFLLDGINGVDGGRGAFFLSGEAGHDLGDDETAEAVVERATD